MRLLDMVTANRIQGGDVDAFEKLIEGHKNRVFNYCLRVVGNYHTAEELSQEIFIKVYRSIESYDWRKASLSTWIYSISRHTCLNCLRDEKFHQTELIKEDFEDTNISLEGQYIIKEDWTQLARAINSLKLEDREIVIMKDYLGFKYGEIGLITGLPPGTVKSRLHGIRMRLKKILGDQNGLK